MPDESYKFDSLLAKWEAIQHPLRDSNTHMDCLNDDDTLRLASRQPPAALLSSPRRAVANKQFKSVTSASIAHNTHRPIPHDAATLIRETVNNENHQPSRYPRWLSSPVQAGLTSLPTIPQGQPLRKVQHSHVMMDQAAKDSQPSKLRALPRSTTMSSLPQPSLRTAAMYYRGIGRVPSPSGIVTSSRIPSPAKDRNRFRQLRDTNSSKSYTATPGAGKLLRSITTPNLHSTNQSGPYPIIHTGQPAQLDPTMHLASTSQLHLPPPPNNTSLEHNGQMTSQSRQVTTQAAVAVASTATTDPSMNPPTVPVVSPRATPRRIKRKSVASSYVPPSVNSKSMHSLVAGTNVSRQETSRSPIKPSQFIQTMPIVPSPGVRRYGDAASSSFAYLTVGTAMRPIGDNSEPNDASTLQRLHRLPPAAFEINQRTLLQPLGPSAPSSLNQQTNMSRFGLKSETVTPKPKLARSFRAFGGKKGGREISAPVLLGSTYNLASTWDLPATASAEHYNSLASLTPPGASKEIAREPLGRVSPASDERLGTGNDVTLAPIRQVLGRQTNSYWAGRLTSLTDRLRNETFTVEARPMDPMSGTAASDARIAAEDVERLQTAFAFLELDCEDDGARASLGEFRKRYAYTNRQPQIAPMDFSAGSEGRGPRRRSGAWGLGIGGHNKGGQGLRGEGGNRSVTFVGKLMGKMRA